MILVKGNSGAMYMDIAVKIIISVIVCSLVSLTILGILDNVYIKNSTLTLEKNQNYANDKNTYNTSIIDGNIIDVEEENEEEEENPLVLFNLADNGANYGNWNIFAGASADANGVTFNRSTEAYLLIDFKQFTQYTVVVKVVSSSPGVSGTVKINYTQPIDISSSSVQKFLITTGEYTNCVVLASNATGPVTIALYGVYEGDCTSIPLVDNPQPYGSVQ